ncbi:hypothetical protein ACFXKD_08485 [Nocardiopsis aegyptia]|uniref:hypothetical protein n=1 Tax=Nocardiopsis aegyptia TaxID=220378 RepID=UPI003670CEC0
MVTSRGTGTAVSAVLMALVLAGCSSGNPADGPDPDAGRRADGDGALPGDAGSSFPEREPPPTATEVLPLPDGPGVAESTIRLQGTPARVVVESLARGGETVELNYVVQNAGNAVDLPIRDFLTEEDDGTWSVAGAELIDSAHSRVHRTARDSQDRCVCSYLHDDELLLSPGDAVRFSATFAAPRTGDVEEMDVRLPLVGTFPGIPLE